MTVSNCFEKLDWQDDRLRINDVLFRLVLSADEQDPVWSDNSYFDLYKPKELVDQYEQALNAFDFKPRTILELGLYDGGSLALWNELFEPFMLVGVDIQTRGDSKYFTDYMSKNRLERRVKTYWGVDQKDSETLHKIYNENYDYGLDMIIDDASHFYEESKISFETLYPLLRPGGLYIIEDWQWSHWKEFQNHDYFKGKQPLTQLITDIIALTGSGGAFAPARINVYSRVAFIQKGLA